MAGKPGDAEFKVFLEFFFSPIAIMVKNLFCHLRPTVDYYLRTSFSRDTTGSKKKSLQNNGNPFIAITRTSVPNGSFPFILALMITQFLD